MRTEDKRLKKQNVWIEGKEGKEDAQSQNVPRSTGTGLLWHSPAAG